MKKELAEKEHQLSVKPTEKAADSELSWLNVLSQETGENVQERINLQKALFELEETNKRNRMELQHLDDSIARHQVGDQFQISSYSADLSTSKGTSNVLFPTTSLEAFLFPFLSLVKLCGKLLISLALQTDCQGSGFKSTASNNGVTVHTYLLYIIVDNNLAAKH